MDQVITRNLMDFIQKSPTAFHAIDTIGQDLAKAGYQQLTEGETWSLSPGGRYFVTRNGSSLIAFAIGESCGACRFQIMASHSDSPTFKLKENSVFSNREGYTVLHTEGYGGMLCATWFDRPLSLAGRVLVKEGNLLKTRLVNVDRDLLMIPSLAYHMNRQANEGASYNKQKDMQPVLSQAMPSPEAVKELVAQVLQVEKEAVYGSELFLYNRTAPLIWGGNNEFVSAPRLDDLQCAFATLQGFLKGNNPEAINVYACFDNEEVGSRTKQGAASTFLEDVLRRINQGLGYTEEAYHQALANSFMVSCDNAHAFHPNAPEKADPEHHVFMNKGLVIKEHAQQCYTSDALSKALFRQLCEGAQVPVQYFANRSDMASGSTLGNIAMTHVSVNCVDVGLPQWAMHAAYETAGVQDTAYLVKVSQAVYSSYVQELTAGVYQLVE